MTPVICSYVAIDHDPRNVILKIDGVEYKFKEGTTNASVNKRFVGYIAQQIESVVPEAVQLIDGILHVDYESLIPYLSESIKQNFRDIRDIKSDTRQIHQVVDMMYAEFIKKEHKKNDKSSFNVSETHRRKPLRWIIGTSLAVILLLSVAVGTFFVLPLVHAVSSNNTTTVPHNTQPSVPLSPDTPHPSVPIQPPQPFNRFPSIDQQTMVDFYYATNGDGWHTTNPSGMKASPSISVCEWSGVTCDGDFRVIQIELNYANLEGTLPASIGSLGQLRELHISANNIYGTIPASIGNLTKLTDINFAYLKFSGSVPLEVFSLSKLTYLSLDKINDLSWTIPPQIGNLKSLEIFSARDSGVFGTIPNEISQLTNLTFLALANNNLTGTVPSLEYARVKYLELQWNQLTGSIPKFPENRFAPSTKRQALTAKMINLSYNSF
ncbi:hypothetical protein HW132_35130, partial [Brasilonema sp. CT11]|nr:hypothetical protein [Brasilonema sp. CT11]